MDDQNATQSPVHFLALLSSTPGQISDNNTDSPSPVSWHLEASRANTRGSIKKVYLILLSNYFALFLNLFISYFQVGVPLNGLVLWALGLRSGRLQRRGSAGGETRAASSFRVYVLNLALADLVLLLRTPLMLVYLANDNSWTLGIGPCRLVIFLRGFGLYASAFLLCAVALERCLCLLKPVWASLRRQRWAVPLACGILWVLAAALAAPYLYTATLFDLNGRHQCLESGTPSTGLFVTETVAGLILPLLVFLGSNVAVLLTVRQTGASASNSCASPSSASASSARRTLRLYRVLFLTMLFFLTCWMPYFICRFLRALAAGRPKPNQLYSGAVKGTYISLYLVYIKSALNPVLYVFAARGLGRTIRASIVSTMERVFNDDSFESARKRTLRRGDSQM
ncbi:C3a anaphylatoxin chemotactic receptor [Aplochiton taeniatus]